MSNGCQMRKEIENTSGNELEMLMHLRSYVYHRFVTGFLEKDQVRYPHFGEIRPIDVQDQEEACIKRICKHFGWNCDVAPNPKASNYEQIKLNLREYIALGDMHTPFRFLSSTRGEGHSSWLVFEDFLEWLDVVEWFSETDWFHHLNDGGYYPWTVSNSFFGKHLRSIEEVSIFLDLLEASHHSAIDVDSRYDT